MMRLLEKGVVASAWACGITLLCAVTGVVGYLIAKGAGSLDKGLIFGDVHPVDALLLRRQVFDGLFPAMVGTLLLVLLSVSLAVPVGIGTGIYLAEYCSVRMKRIFGHFFDILAATPSIVIGFFGFSVTIFLHRYLAPDLYPCLMISALALAFLVLPYLIRTTQTALEGIPASLRRAAPALGATPWQNISLALLPQALPGIISGTILAIGRCAEDTAVIMLTGVVATAGIPRSLWSGYEALPFYIYTVSSQYADSRELMRGYGAAIILLIICTLLFSLAFFIQSRLKRRALYRP